MKILKFIVAILLWLTVAFAFIWVGAQVAVKVWGFPQTVIFVSSLVGVNPDFFVDTQGTGIENPTLNVVYEASYNIFFVASFIAGIGGVLVLSHGRTFPEIVWLFTAFLLPKQRKYWGKIYDKISKQNLSFATVRLLEKDSGKFVVQAISDLDGSYRVTINDRSKAYVLEVSAHGYDTQRLDFDSQNMLIVNKSLVADIGLTPTGKERAQSVLVAWEDLRTKLYRPTILFIFSMSLLSLFFGIYGIISYPDSLPNQVSLLLSIIAVSWNASVLRQRFLLPSGAVLDMENKSPLQNVQVKVFNDTQQLVSTQTDANGISKIDLPPGTYRAQFVKAGFGLPNNQEFTQISINNKGFIEDNIMMQRTSAVANSANSTETSSADLLNPFS